LLPKGMRVLRELGVFDRIESEGFVLKSGARFWNQQDQLDITMLFAHAPEGAIQPTALQVERERYDEILLDAARARGVDVWMPATVRSVDVASDRVNVSVERDEQMLEVSAPIIFDSSGQDSYMSRVRGYRKRLPKLLTHAFFGYFKGLERKAMPEGGNITIAFVPNGWLWYIPLRNDVTSVGVVLLDGAARPAGGPKEILLGFMKSYLPNADKDFEPKLVSIVRAYSAINFCSSKYVDDRLMLVGDAAAFLDPVFSTGVCLGMWGGRYAAKTAAAALKAGSVSRDALVGYERQMRTLHQIAHELVQLFYRGGFITLLRRAKEEGESAPFAVRDISGLLAGDFLNESNNLARTLMKRTRPEVSLAEM
jgi:halogenation protein CepH